MKKKKGQDEVYSSLEVIILAGGLGTRLADCLGDTPKCLAPINNVPFISYILEKLQDLGFQNICLATGYLSSNIEMYIKETDFNLNIRFSKEHSQLGTGGAVKKSIKSSCYDNFLVINGDTYFDFDLKNLVTENTRDYLVLTCFVDKSDQYGKVISNSKNLITRFEEKNSKGEAEVNAGVYLLHKSVIQYMPNDVFSLEKETFIKLVEEKLLYKKNVQGKFIDIGTPENYHIAQREIS